MPDLDLSALRKVAEAATPGPWRKSSGITYVHGANGDVVASVAEHKDWDFIAQANPATVLALLDELENARTTIEEDKRHFAKAWEEGFVAASRNYLINPYIAP